MFDDHEWNAVGFQQFPRPPRTVGRAAQPRDLPEEVAGHHAGRVADGVERLGRGRQRLPAPRLERVRVRLGVRAQAVRLAVEGRVGRPPSAGSLDQSSDERFGLCRQIRHVRDPAALRQSLEGKPGPIDVRRRVIRRSLLPTQQHIRRNPQVFVERARHRHRDRPPAGQDLRDLRTAPDEWDQVAPLQPRLLHAKLDGGHRVGISHRLAPALIQFDEVGQHVELPAIRRFRFRVHDLVDPGERGLVVGFGPNRPDVGHRHTSSTFTASYSACVPMNRT